MNDPTKNDAILLHEGWRLRSSADVSASGDAISTPGFAADDWLKISAPQTVLAALVENGIHPDPFEGTNLRELPGQGPAAKNFSNFKMPEESPFAVSWWYRKAFRAPTRRRGDRVYLRFDGINYRASIWVNGKRLRDETQITGAYREYEIDVTDVIDLDGENVVAVEVRAPNPCDLGITWVDWNPSPPDKNMGLWRDVWLSTSGPVAVRHSQVVTRLSPDHDLAELTIVTQLVNGSAAPVETDVRVELEQGTIEKTIGLAAGESTEVIFSSADHSELRVEEPKLWWPRLYGPQHLHDARIEARVDGRPSDAERVRFGIREVVCKLTESKHSLFEVNGRPILIKGAGWAPDLLQRPDVERDEAQLQYVIDMNLNTIRFEGMLERNRFLRRCDEEGILVIAGWCCCDHWEKWESWKDEDHEVSAESLRSQIRRIRNHPCLISWWYGSDFPPPAEVERRYLAVLEEERWPNAAHSSAANKPTEVTGESGMKMNGPYDYVPPSYWLEDADRGGAFGFATEICPGAAIPPIESLRKMIPEDHLWPIDDVWCFRAGGQEFHNVDLFTNALVARYGKPATVEDYATTSQLVTYEAQRAMFEGYARNKYRATGVVQWMLNNSWPSLIWHLFDWYLRPAGGYFGTKKACEPLHVMFGSDDRRVAVVNDHLRAIDGLRVRARLTNLDMTEVWAGDQKLDAGPDSVVRAMTVPQPSELDETHLLWLELTDAEGTRVSDNVYWLSKTADRLDHEKGNWFTTPMTQTASFHALRDLPETEVDAEMVVETDGHHETARVTITNRSDHVAFFVQLRLTDADAGDDALPVLWDDNYVSLPPGASREIAARFDRSLLDAPAVEVTGFNVRRALVVPLKAAANA